MPKPVQALAFCMFVLLVLLRVQLPALADTRVALVIGNGAYQHTAKLANPANDGEDVAAALRAVGFKVRFIRDAGKTAVDDALGAFAQAASEADVALFYYAGHGMQFEGRNYLMPVDAELANAASLDHELIDIGAIKAVLAHSKGVKILVLDACRDNPLGTQFIRTVGGRGISNSVDPIALRGLSRIERVSGMIIAYATQADAVAQDGTGRNSPFSSAFLHQIRQPGLEVGVLFRRISAEVFAATSGRQEPEVSLSNIPDYFLNGEPINGSPAVTASLGPSGPSAAVIDPRLLVPSIRSELRRLGCYAGADADWGTPPMSHALEETRRRAPHLPADASPSVALLEGLDAMPPHLCPPPRPVGLESSRPQARGSPVRPSWPHTAKVPPVKAVVAAVSVGLIGKRCFSFKGKGYCE